MQKSNGSMGNSKHRKSGKATKSPRHRFHAKLDAERAPVTLKKRKTQMYGSMSELMNAK